jgi:hypothetical protein
MKSPRASVDTANVDGQIVKKCPECMAYMPLNVTVCPACKLPVGKVTKHGMASRKTNWKSYAVAIAAWLFFFFYIWWAFIREQ